MDDKLITGDFLSGLNACLTTISGMIAQSEAEDVYSKLKSIRDRVEQTQRTVYKYAKSKGYYIPAAPAEKAQIDVVKNQVTQS